MGVAESMTPDPKTIDAIYKAYPRHVAPRAAKAAIKRALERIYRQKRETTQAALWLLYRVQAFAASPKGKGDHCPYPATWFNRGSYDDDEAEWNRAGESKEGKHNDRDGPTLKRL